MLRQLMQRWFGGGASPEAQAATEERQEAVHEERVDAALGLVHGEGVMPDGEVAHFDSDEEPPPEIPA
jgi:hypothetical protein